VLRGNVGKEGGVETGGRGSGTESLRMTGERSGHLECDRVARRVSERSIRIGMRGRSTSKNCITAEGS